MKNTSSHYFAVKEVAFIRRTLWPFNLALAMQQVPLPLTDVLASIGKIGNGCVFNQDSTVKREDNAPAKQSAENETDYGFLHPTTALYRAGSSLKNEPL
ncbi:MAG: hypothetical protein ACJA09_003574 [Alcanivorax sp.]|jgi:hypothetical protein